jgi:hypothetical protein
MWSHYADNHRGFCIEYDTQTLAPEHPFVKALYPAIYSEQFFDGTEIVLGVFGGRRNLSLDYLMLSALYKSPEWEYEQEWRLIVRPPTSEEKSLFQVPTPKRVYLGSRMEKPARQEIASICRQKRIGLFEMHLATDAFRLYSEKVVD